MRKAACLIIVLLLLTAFLPTMAQAENEIWDGSIATAFAGGTGIKTDPYLISTGAELALLAARVNSGNSFVGKYFALKNNLYMNIFDGWYNWDSSAPQNEWTSIGTFSETGESRPFCGYFDGGGYEIWNLYIKKTGSAEDKNCHGLFGYCQDAEISAVTVRFSYMKANDCVGAIVGRAATSRIDAKADWCKINGSSYIGGIVGRAYKSTISNSAYDGQVSCGKSFVGGIVGCNVGGTIQYCSNKAEVIANGSTAFYAGGIAGVSSGDWADAVVDRCFNKGKVWGVSSGGLVGFVEAIDHDSSIRDCYNTGNIQGNGATGGLVGLMRVTHGNARMENCYNIGTVDRTANPCGLAGNCMVDSNDGGIIFTNCFQAEFGVSTFYLIDVTSQKNPTESNVAALSDEQLKQQSSYTGFDFNTIWTMDGDAGYAYAELRPMAVTPRGDSNGDGAVDASDASHILRYIVRLVKESEIDLSAADVDGVKGVTAADASKILRWIVKLEKEL